MSARSKEDLSKDRSLHHQMFQFGHSDSINAGQELSIMLRAGKFVRKRAKEKLECMNISGI